MINIAPDPQENEDLPDSTYLTADKFLCFQIDDELHGFELKDVQEILRDVVITRVPNTVPWLLGVANLRGRVTPIFDLRERLSAEASSGHKRWVVVLEVEVQGSPMAVGAVVDSLPEVISLQSNQIQTRNEKGGKASFIVALGKTGDKVVLILDPSRLINYSEAAMEGAEE